MTVRTNRREEAVGDVSVRLGPLRLSHPLINASGTLDLFEAAQALGADFLEDPPVACYVPKTVTRLPRGGTSRRASWRRRPAC